MHLDNIEHKATGGNWGMYLGRCSEVDDTVQLDVLAKLVVQPAMPVLVDGPFGLIQAFALVQVGCENVPEE